MRLLVLNIIALFFHVFSFAQQKTNLNRIDSLKRNVLRDKSQDSLFLARTHYKIAELYRFSFLPDSAYYHYFNAEKIFKKFNSDYDLALALYGIAVIQKNEKDFTGSEITSIEALLLLNKLEQTNNVKKYKSYVYNNLGLLFSELGQYEESISYHKTAIQIKKEYDLDNTYNTNVSKNNLALSYKKAGKYELALNYYSEILSNENLIKEYSDFYALVLNNYGHTLYLSNNKEQIPKLYFRALKVTDSVNPRGYNSIIINQHLAEYYNDKKNKDSAKYYAYNAKEISEQYHNDQLLSSLLLLSEIEEDSSAAKHLRAYINLNDSLQKAERTIRNKFTRIKYETNQIEEENKQIAKERTWLVILSIVLIVASFLLYMTITQRNKNKELQFIQKQQEANEEIYNLMLSQNAGIEEARDLEKKRISQELHDGVLGRLFGTRLSLDSLNMSSSMEAVKTRDQYIQELKTIEDDIRKVSHELNADFVSGSKFIDIINTLVETQTIAYSLKYELKTDGGIDWDEVSNKKKIHIYRIIQESLHNIYKHAKAKSVNISFKLKNNVILLSMIDDGAGFDVNKAKSGIGLKNMRSRIKEINGTISITSKRDIGTIVNIEAPMT